MPPILITEDMAAYRAGRPGSTIRRWAAEGRIGRYGAGRGRVRYRLDEIPGCVRDAHTGVILSHGDPPPLPGRPQTGSSAAVPRAA
ncbi:hypothetical protein [Streptomyces sp. MP131-18]|uniref:hypothetical protein n=1 Tax=Streptomyces sp. MP131-18 TaxID=1857892 RepID=UPI00097C790F|nr:hypothetical protein [Streptomyces sp. MP131-18]ONK09451.1 hypothetical protein STBA_01510 [Streptomyces sp. MP131-18]